jgi:multiple sugar transport system permease protein
MANLEGTVAPPAGVSPPSPPGAAPEPGPVARAEPVRRGLLGARRIPYLVLLIGAAVLFVYPFVWLISASLKPRTEVFDNALIPHTFAPSNFVRVWEAAPLLTWLINSAVVGFAAAAAVTFSSAMVGFGFAYFRFPARNLLFGLVLATMMLPAAVTMIPVYLIWNELGLVNTQVPLWAVNLFGSAFYIFLLRQFFLGLPRELFEAARVDGCGYFGLFWRIAVPLARPALIIAFVFELKASWTDLMRPLIYLQDSSLFTVPRGLKVIVDRFGQAGEQEWEIVLAASVIATIPMIVLFAIAQRHIVNGIATTGRKG